MGRPPGEGGEEHPVTTTKLRPTGVSLHHRQLMAKHKDLGLTLASIALRRDVKDKTKDEVENREKHRAMLLRRTSR